ncbi:DUF905 family protein [Escherichia coli]|nr:DUF905 domain-containing protein [Escherichia coli]HCK5698931.1 DUF905 family protein [Salmonella enterica subsp. enterica serovar Typhi str. CT18]HEH1403342.1 DUF905 family protein [Salmonella enterica]EEV6988927.1 DUF905 domain-containing protein [Escherichia coli]EEW8805070.1 DUF905 domain-containing protein [Escherichia coli]
MAFFSDFFCKTYVPFTTRKSFSREQALTITTAYCNVFIENDQGTHFRRVIRNAEGQLRW